MADQVSMFEEDAPNYASSTFPPPRDFQSKARLLLREGAKQGHKNQMVMAPTGSGKLYLGLWLIQEALIRGRRAIFVCDRTTLIDQASESADKYGLSAHGIMQADHWRTNKDLPFQICSAQTMQRREWPDADLIIVDEAHTQLKAWTEHVPNCRAKVIGLSATPFSKGLGRLFTNLINATTADELTKLGVLVPMKVMSCERIDMTGAETSGGEWTEAAAAERGMAIVGDAVVEWSKYGENRKTIAFGPTIDFCETLARQFNEAGINAAVFTSKTTKEERKVLLDEFRKPDSRIRILISVEALAKGFDVPDVSCVIDMRPLRKSLSTAIQMWGRGLRSSPSTGKEDCILLDHSGNIQRFAADYEEIFFNGLDALDAGEKLDKAIREEDEEEAKKGCPACGYTPYAKRCICCGYERPVAEKVVVEAGVMRPLQIGQSKKSQAALEIWFQCVTYARSRGQGKAPEKQRGHASAIYKDITGVWPDRFGMSFEKAPNVPLTREVSNMIKAKQIAYAAAMQKQKQQAGSYRNDD